MSNSPSRAFLKWAGGKFKLLHRLEPHLQGHKLIEPFVGGGAVFLNQRFGHYWLADVNPDLIELFKTVQQEGETFIGYAQSFFTTQNNEKASYLKLRDEFNQGVTGRRRAAIFLYLNRHGFNGLCRYNRSGGFNVPFGSYRAPYFPDKEMLQFHLRSQQAEFACESFEVSMNRAKHGDLVYCDPPYVPLSPSSKFTDYAQNGFGSHQQEELALRAEQLASRGVKVVISNHDTPLTRELYHGAEIESFPVQRYISSNGSNRGLAKELLAIYHPKNCG